MGAWRFLVTQSGSSEPVPLIRQCRERAQGIPFHKRELPLLFRHITRHSKGCSDRIPISDPRLSAFHIWTSTGRHQEDRDTLALLDPFSDGLPKRSKALRKRRDRSSDGSVRLDFPQAPLYGCDRIFPQTCAYHLLFNRGLHVQSRADRT